MNLTLRVIGIVFISSITMFSLTAFTDEEIERKNKISEEFMILGSLIGTETLISNYHKYKEGFLQTGLNDNISCVVDIGFPFNKKAKDNYLHVGSGLMLAPVFTGSLVDTEEIESKSSILMPFNLGLKLELGNSVLSVIGGTAMGLFTEYFRYPDSYRLSEYNLDSDSKWVFMPFLSIALDSNVLFQKISFNTNDLEGYKVGNSGQFNLPNNNNITYIIDYFSGFNYINSVFLTRADWQFPVFPFKVEDINKYNSLKLSVLFKDSDFIDKYVPSIDSSDIGFGLSFIHTRSNKYQNVEGSLYSSYFYHPNENHGFSIGAEVKALPEDDNNHIIDISLSQNKYWKHSYEPWEWPYEINFVFNYIIEFKWDTWVAIANEVKEEKKGE